MKKVRFYDETGEVVYAETLQHGQLNIAFPDNNLPRNAKIYITSDLLTTNLLDNTIYPLTIAKNEVGDLDARDVMLRFESDTLNFEDAIVIAYQGNSTLQNPKKGFGIDFASKHTFGNWIAMDSYHLKGYYIDWTHTRDIVSNRLLEQILRTREYYRPYMQYNDFTDEDTYKLMENRTLSHIDGFPAQLYINGDYWGLYTLTIKKELDNYYLQKKNTNHIMFEPDIQVGQGGITTSTWDWTKIEIRCPKKAITNMDGTPYDGDNPQEIAPGPVKTAMMSFISKLTAITTSTSKATISSFLDVDGFIDWYLFCWFVDNIDIVGKNTLYTTWDAEHWHLLIYDLDNTYGMYVWNKGDAQHQPTYDTFTHKAIGFAPWLVPLTAIYASEIKARYKELRNSVFTLENIKNLFNQQTTEIGTDNYEKDLKRWNYDCYGHSSEHFYFSTKKIFTWIEGRMAFLDNKFK